MEAVPGSMEAVPGSMEAVPGSSMPVPPWVHHACTTLGPPYPYTPGYTGLTALGGDTLAARAWSLELTVSMNEC